MYCIVGGDNSAPLLPCMGTQLTTPTPGVTVVFGDVFHLGFPSPNNYSRLG